MKVNLQTKSGLFEFDVRAEETVLAAGLRQGITLPYECATGTCGTCRGRGMEGAAEMPWAEAPGAAKLKLDRGDCLLCQTYLASDAVVRVPSDTVHRNGDARPLPDHGRGRLTGLRLLTHDVMHFDLALEHPMRFDAGQFVTMQGPGIAGARAYSMVNHADETDRLGFVVKRKPDGRFCDWLFETAETGAEIAFFGPLGAATFHPEERRNILCIAGGSGIAGIMSILTHATAVNHFADHRGDVFFGVRTLADCFYLDELSEFAAKGDGNLGITVALSHEDPGCDRHPDFPLIRLDTGFVHEAAGRAMAGRYEHPLGYLAGPPPMVDAAIRVLIGEGKIPVKDIRYDKFG